MTEIYLQDAIAALLSVRRENQTDPKFTIQKATGSYATPGEVVTKREDAFTEGFPRQEIGDYLTHIDEYWQAKQVFAQQLEQKYPGIVENIRLFGARQGIYSDAQGTTVTTDHGEKLYADASGTVTLPNNAHSSKFSSAIGQFAEQYGYPAALEINSDYKNVEALQAALPKPERHLVPAESVELLGTYVVPPRDPMSAATNGEQPFGYRDFVKAQEEAREAGVAFPPQ